ncbi:hypothetical protein Tco_0188471, partial [Tanacetum coccineum]
ARMQADRMALNSAARTDSLRYFSPTHCNKESLQSRATILIAADESLKEASQLSFTSIRRKSIDHASLAKEDKNFVEASLDWKGCNKDITREVIVPDKPSKRRPKVDPNQTGLVHSHSNNKCSTVSGEEWQIRHVGEVAQFRRNKASRVARAFEQALHQKFLIFGTVFKRQVCFLNSVGHPDEDA